MYEKAESEAESAIAINGVVPGVIAEEVIREHAAIIHSHFSVKVLRSLPNFNVVLSKNYILFNYSYVFRNIQMSKAIDLLTQGYYLETVTYFQKKITEI